MPYSSHYPPIELDNTDLYTLIFGSLTAEDEQRTAIIDLATGTRSTYGELKSKVDAFAGWLQHRGINKGDVIALHCPNSEAYLIAAHGVWRIGAVLTPLSLLSTEKSVTTQLADSGARMLLTVNALGDTSPNGAREYGMSDDNIIWLDNADGLPAILTAGHQPQPVNYDVDQDLASLPYSSGTSGLPKGVKLTHRQLVVNVRQAMECKLVHSDDTVLGVLPFFHIYGMTAIANLTLAMRATLVTMPKFDLEQFLKAHQEFHVTFTFIAPPIAVLLAKHPLVGKYDLSSLRALFSGAAALDEGLALALEKLQDVHVQQGYGMTETSPLVFANVRKEISRGSVGELAPNTEYKLIDPTTSAEVPLPTSNSLSELGELWVRGPQNMIGYLNRPEETANVLPGDGWLRTGDLACHNAAGHMFIVDRLKELIKYKGYQVPPAELEALLLTHPAIADAAVIGITREEDGEEIPKAFVVVQAGQQLSEQEVMDFVAEHVAPYKKVRTVEFIAVIPKSATGKILRRQLRARA